ncbi:MAG: MlaD family protein [Verrucomicrobiia bacterium]|jgi:phospholipid/cholesterol/gamma-HCH transport system substrate-binding protein
MEERFKFRHVNAITGTFVLAVVAVLIAAIVWTSHSQRWFRSNATLRIVLPATGAAGIRQGSEVYFLGTLVGTVSDVSVDPTGRMEARVNIRRDFFLFVRADSSAVVKRKFGVMGDAYFEITRGHGQPLREKDASIVCNEPQPSALETALEEVRREAVPALNKLSAGLDAWTKLGTDLGETRQQLNQLIARLDNIVAGVEQGKGTAGRLLTDPTVADELEELLAKANASMDELKLILGNVQQASTNFPAIAGSVNQSAQDLPALVAQTQQTMHEIERLVRGMQRHWLIRKYVEQADAAATNKASRVKKP